MEHIIYSYTIKDMPVRLMILIYVNNGLGLMAEDIVNALCTAPCAENIFSCCDAWFCARCGSEVVLRRSLYGFNTY